MRRAYLLFDGSKEVWADIGWSGWANLETERVLAIWTPACARIRTMSAESSTKFMAERGFDRISREKLYVYRNC